jgi:hypothetical protein
VRRNFRPRLSSRHLQFHQLLGGNADHLPQQIRVDALLNSERWFIFSPVIGGLFIRLSLNKRTLPENHR